MYQFIFAKLQTIIKDEYFINISYFNDWCEDFEKLIDSLPTYKFTYQNISVDIEFKTSTKFKNNKLIIVWLYTDEETMQVIDNNIEIKSKLMRYVEELIEHINDEFKLEKICKVPIGYIAYIKNKFFAEAISDTIEFYCVQLEIQSIDF